LLSNVKGFLCLLMLCTLFPFFYAEINEQKNLGY
jgi:hypothetical protein